MNHMQEILPPNISQSNRVSFFLGREPPGHKLYVALKICPESVVLDLDEKLKST